MICLKCKAENPDDAKFCFKCGEPFEKEMPTDEKSQEHSQQSNENCPPPGATPSGQPQQDTLNDVVAKMEYHRSSYKWALAYGWLFIAAAIYLLLSGIRTLVTGFDITPSPSLWATRKIGLVSSIGQGLLFLATGLAIVKKRIVAIKLVWIVIILDGLGVIFRGIVPLDLMTWIVSFGLAKWFSSKRSFLK
ncbi:MAG: zinc ribbon domain-containing protein [Elusimicrobiota bacterium]